MAKELALRNIGFLEPARVASMPYVCALTERRLALKPFRSHRGIALVSKLLSNMARKY